MSQTRWKCPDCGHGLLAPERPRKNDVRRYCLPCSGKKGVLVERIAPRLEAARAAAKVKQAEKEKKARAVAASKRAPEKAAEARARQRQRIFDTEADRIWKLIEEHVGRRLGGRPRIDIAVARQHYVGASGLGSRSRARIVLGKYETGGKAGVVGGEWVWNVLAHELVHGALHTTHKDREGAHGRHFYECLRYVAEKRWRIRVTGWHQINGYTDTSHSWGYKVDDIIVASLRAAKVVNFEFPPIAVRED